jgi:hypothetical protein
MLATPLMKPWKIFLIAYKGGIIMAAFLFWIIAVMIPLIIGAFISDYFIGKRGYNMFILWIVLFPIVLLFKLAKITK